MAVKVFGFPGSDAIRISYDDGEGGIYELNGRTLDLEEVGDVPNEWVELTPSR